MGKASKIEWTHHTFNPWWGCTKVSAACKYCYAETFSKRVGHQVWGKKAQRRFFSNAHWDEPIKWNALAEQRNERHRVFCASMADVFEPRKELDISRQRLWQLIEKTPSLDWLLLTKRPGSIGDMVPWQKIWPDNVWLGTTVESDKWLCRVERLIRYPAKIRFLSCEPLLTAVDLTAYINQIDWVIAGGESGQRARQTQPQWVRALRDQCQDANVAFHFKQWGHWAPKEDDSLIPLSKKRAGRLLDQRTWDAVPNYQAI